MTAPAEPVFGAPKSGRSGTIDLAPETVTMLHNHRRQQAELKMKNRSNYRDHGVVFAREQGHLKNGEDSLGLSLRAANLGDQQFTRIIETAKVRKISVHGLRYTSATLMLANGESVPVVQQRLGHVSPMMTLSVYAHALSSMQQSAAQRLGKLLHG